MGGSMRAWGFKGALVALAAFGAALLALILLAGGPAVAGSTDLIVTKTADENDGSCDQNDCSLREAIIQSNSPSGADNIELPAGTYKLTIRGSNEDFAATGDLDIRRGVTIRPQESGGKVIIDGGGIDRVFHTPIQFPSPGAFNVSIFGVKITGGVSDFGGGIFHDAQGATLHLGRSTVSGNQGVSGGGIVAQRGPLTVVESTISGNRAPGGLGGGIHLGGTAGAGPYTLTNTTVSGNQSRFGGGITTYDPVTITDSTIAFNTAQQPGGGLHVGGGPGPYTLKNTIISNNRSDFPEKNCVGENFVVSQGYNLENGTSCGLDQPSDINAKKPKLGKLANNGGPTNTHALLKGSRAIDAGGAPFPPTDQRGVARPRGAANDIGAFEK